MFSATKHVSYRCPLVEYLPDRTELFDIEENSEDESPCTTFGDVKGATGDDSEVIVKPDAQAGCYEKERVLVQPRIKRRKRRRAWVWTLESIETDSRGEDSVNEAVGPTKTAAAGCVGDLSRGRRLKRPAH